MMTGSRYRSRLTGSIVEVDLLAAVEKGGHDGVHFHYVKVARKDADANVQVGSKAWMALVVFADSFDKETA